MHDAIGALLVESCRRTRFNVDAWWYAIQKRGKKWSTSAWKGDAEEFLPVATQLAN